MKKTSAILAFLAAAAASFPGISRAAPAPDLRIASVLNAPVSGVKGLKDLKGKVVYLDFWATWCAPCVASIPHINRLHEALKGEPVIFIAVTDEAPAKVGAFLKTHEIKSWVGIDTGRSAGKAYKVNGLPDGYLIGRDGALLARIPPERLEEKDVRDAIAGKFNPVPVVWENAKPGEKKPEADNALFEIKISSAGRSNTSGIASGSGEIRMETMRFASGIAYLWDVEPVQVIMDTQPAEALNITLKAPKGGLALGKETLKTALQAAFGISVTTEQKEMDVYVLALSTAPGAPRPAPGAPEVHAAIMACGEGQLIGTAEMPRIARSLWENISAPVVDETGLNGTYEFDLKWKDGDQAALDKLLAAQGLTLTPARRAIEFLRVAPVKP